MKHPLLSKPNAILALLLAAWWLLNLVQGAFTELADDEAYYWFFSWQPAWGYFDHPPMTAILVWLGSWIPGTLGVRLFTTLLQPLCLYLFWTLIRPPQPSIRQAVIYFLICFSLPLLQIYGFLALPDAPLLLFSVLFLWAFNRFSNKQSISNASILALSMALLVYSKYHGVLIIIFTLLSNPRNFKSWKLYYSGLLALLLFLPHLWWQYQHDFISLQYHLLQRADDATFQLSNLLGFFIILLFTFNPLWLYHYGVGIISRFTFPAGKTYNIRDSLFCILAGFVIFFLLCSLRDNVQAQWLLPIIFALITFLFDAATSSNRSYNYIRTAAIVVAVIFILIRLLVIFNPFQFKGQLWNNHDDNQAIALLADGRPVLFTHNYTASCKYTYYTGQPAYTQALFYGRDSQWQFSNLDDSLFLNRNILVAVEENAYADTLILPSGKEFHYISQPNYKPLRKVQIAPLSPIQASLAQGDSLQLDLRIVNPYPYNLYTTPTDSLLITFSWRISQRQQPELHHLLLDTLPAHSSTIVHCSFALPPQITSGQFSYVFSLRHHRFPSCANSPRHILAFQQSSDSITLQQQP